MSDIDTDALWQELQKEEKIMKSSYKSNKKNNKKDKFWRRQSSQNTKPKKKKENNRWIKNISKQSDTNPNKLTIKSSINSIKHGMNLLNDTNSATSKRIDALNFINNYLNNYNFNNNQEIDTMDILKNLIKVFVDKKEPLRSLSIDIVENHIGNNGFNNNNIWDYKTSIKYIIPIIVHCILNKEYQENSEEIRLKLLNLLQKIISFAKNEEEIKPICGDLIAILIKLLNDKYSEINKLTCQVIIELSAKIRLNVVTKLIIENSLQLLSHRHTSVKIRCIKLIECMLLNGGHECIQTLTAFREYNNVPLSWWFEGEIRSNYFGSLCRDKNINVRLTFFQMIFNIMINMKERYDYKTLLLSYVITGLQDENKEIQQQTFQAMEKIGKMHELDEYNDLKRELFYQKQAELITKRHFYGDDDDEFKLPFPFEDRPCLGSRILIREHFGRIINAAINEFTDWKLECREMAVLLVRNMIIYSEEFCTQNAELLLKSLLPLIADENEIIRNASRECCGLIGRFVYPLIWLDYLSDIVYHEFNDKSIIMLYELMLYCPWKRIFEVKSQVIALLEYALPLIDNENKEVLKQNCVDIVNKVMRAMTKYDGDDEKNDTEEESDDDFVFSSEYCGFHLEIIDETEENEMETNSDEQNKRTLQHRIDILMKLL